MLNFEEKTTRNYSLTNSELSKRVSKRRSRTAISSANVVDRKLVKQTTNQFYTYAKLDQKRVDEDLSNKIKPIALEIDQFENRHITTLIEPFHMFSQ